MANANDSTLTAEQALDEVLSRLTDDPTGWRFRLERAAEIGWPESVPLNRMNRGVTFTLGDLRRWSAPLRTEG